jgi:hypothetical protein
MIRFLCPACRAVLEFPDHKAGTKIPCPVCSQRLLIPPPVQAQNKTILGQPLPESPPSASMQATGPVPDWLPDVERPQVDKSELNSINLDTGPWQSPDDRGQPLHASADPQSVPEPPPRQVPIGDCPGCHEPLSVSEALVGRWIECPKCGMGFAALAENGPPVQPLTPASISTSTLPSNLFTGCLAIGTALVLTGTLVILAISHPFPSKVVNEVTTFLAIVAVVGMILFVIVSWDGIKQRCSNPSCRKWWARVKLDRKLIKRTHAYTTVTRHVDNSGITFQGGRMGYYFGGGSTEEQVHVLRRYYENYYECKCCRHKWSETTIEDEENFEEDEEDDEVD